MQHLIFITAGNDAEPNEQRVKELLEALGLRSVEECDCPRCTARREAGKVGIDPSKLPVTGRVPDTSVSEQIKKLEENLDKAVDKFVSELCDSVVAAGNEGRVWKELVKRGWTPPGDSGITYPEVKRNDGGYTAEGVAYLRGWNECRIAVMQLNRKS